MVISIENFFQDTNLIRKYRFLKIMKYYMRGRT